MKTSSIRLIGIVLLLPVIAAAQDNLTFSMPLIVTLDQPQAQPRARFSYEHTIGTGSSVDVDRFGAVVDGLDWAITPDTGIGGAFQANRANFQQALPHWQPWSMNALMGTAGIWHRFGDDWTVEAAFTRTTIHEHSGFDGLFTRENANSYSGAVSYRIDAGWRLIAGASVTPQVLRNHKAYIWPLVELVGQTSSRWEWLIGYPTNTVAYQLNRHFSVYGGIAAGDDVFDGTGVPGTPNSQDFHYFRESDVKVGVIWRISRWWSLDASVAVPIEQKFGPHP